ncbi:hypothetical protein VTK73DRAFT_2934 [Phialemonium thermophilum]|uniref:Co-chaperone HscB C-terminal oligomerisation domain-containing protein n=1 Tax=Phialemonium thermophilum TaxID=223376 RepID=A0ABR3X1Z6_9PEZI
MRSSLLNQPSRAVCSACRRAAALAARHQPQQNFSSWVGTANRSRITTTGASYPRRSGVLLTAASESNRRFLSHTSRQSTPTAASKTSTAEGAEELSSSSSSSSSGRATTGETEVRSDSGAPDYYALFPATLTEGAPPKGPFHIDTRALRREFLRLQAAAHPDLQHHQRLGGREGEDSIQDGSSSSPPPSASQRATTTREAGAASALLNEAYRTLCSPLLRAQYLLRTRYGIDVTRDDEPGGTTGGGGGFNWQAEPEVLMQAMEAREAVEEATTEEELEAVRKENEGRIQEAEEGLARAFSEGDVEAAVREVVRLRYWVNVEESIREWEAGKPVVLQH